MTRSVSFSDHNRSIPEDILFEKYFRPFTSPEEDKFCKNLRADSATLQRCARILQRFIRDNIPHWRYFNDQKSRIIEDMDDVLVMKKGELERVTDCMEDMKREAKMEVAMEYGAEDIEDDQDFKTEVEEQRREVKELEAENIRLRKEAEEAKSKNKKIAMDTFSMYEAFAKASYDIKGMKVEQRRLDEICTKYSQCVKTLKGMVKTVKADISTEKRERQRLEECMNQVIESLEKRYSKRKLIAKLQKIKFSALTQAAASPIEV